MSRPFIVGDSSPFLKRVLIPFWVIRILIMIIQITLYVLVIVGLDVFRDDLERLYDEYHTTLSYDAVFAISCVIMVIILLCLVLDIVCIVMRARRTLTPPFFLGVNIAQSTFYVVNFGLTMAGPRNGVASIVISVLILLSFLGLLVYASVIFHQYRTGSLNGGAYVPAGDPEVHNFVAETSYPPIADVPRPPRHSYTSDYPNQLSYGEGAQGYSTAGVGAPRGGAVANAAYEPFRPADGGTEESMQRQEYEMHQNSEQYGVHQRSAA
ncbi:hypothetical protein C7999DRAFT_14443 [Corynascus novoguineensis]|uniref:Uncharacterized protein n=1 Tax=Corynascus novoguineensis TaxID=1126955 RepID=A0AAN7CSI3_9PEZI|nr:hypothetical protein C7999DRAFT_14443 [Corynascus novoguineensis]